jgi:hypothetical protein
MDLFLSIFASSRGGENCKEIMETFIGNVGEIPG